MEKPYAKRTDLQKLRSQWRKLTGLHTREEWSAAVVRAATAAELAANFAIRKEFKRRSNLDAKFVDGLLTWANGLAGKIRRLLIPLSQGQPQLKAIKKIRAASQQINEKRNSIVHRGEFCSENEAKAIIQQTRQFIETLVRIYKPEFVLQSDKTH